MAAAAPSAAGLEGLGHAVGYFAFIWGFPLVESVRTCRLQVAPRAAERASWSAPIDQLHHVSDPAGPQDRDVVTPANDLLYSTGWLNLDNGPRLIRVPSSRSHGSRYFVIALYDAWTQNFANLGSRGSGPEGELVWLASERDAQRMTAPDGARVLIAPTGLVMVIARVMTGPGEDLPKARALQREIDVPMPNGGTRLPACVMGWQGRADVDALTELQSQPEQSAAICDAFLLNLSQSLRDQATPAQDQGVLQWLGTAGLGGSANFSVDALKPELRRGLHSGILAAAELMHSRSRSRSARPWTVHFGVGRYDNPLVRALTAFRGFGALAPEEAVYAMSDFDRDGVPLDGRNFYKLTFKPDDMPPSDAFWSVTLYAADRFLYANPLGRSALGSLSQGLEADADGGLTLGFGNAMPEVLGGKGQALPTSNWLPAPPGPFYLVLRLYAPRQEVRTWKIPPLVCTSAALKAQG